MSQVISVVLRNASATRTLILSAALATSVGCAHQSDQQMAVQQSQLQATQARLDEAERTNGRLTVRIEELEDDVFLLQDRVDANRIALQRKGIMSNQAQANYQKPAPSPETYWGENSPATDPRTNARPVTRIQLGGGDNRDWRVQGEAYREQVPTNVAPTRRGEESELVITEKEFGAFEAAHGGPKRSKAAPSRKGAKAPQVPVTDQRLPTTQELNGGPAPEKKAPPKPASRKDALGSYKDALAEYRGGKYEAALGGFEEFLASGPQADYVDNALYWIGECHFGLGQYDKAVQYFQRVMSEQPDGNKVPDAMLKMSLAYDRVGKGSEGTQMLEDLKRQYPATNAGRLATQKLEER